MAPQILAPRPATRQNARETDTRTTRLPTELVQEQARRLAAFAGVAFLLWSVALTVDVVVLPSLSATWQRNWRIIPIELAGALGSALLRWYLRRADTSADRRDTLGLAVLLLNSALIAAANTWAMPLPLAADELVGRPSWIALAIVIFAMIAPSTPRRMLAASLVAACFDPIGYVIVGALGLPAPTFVQALVLSWPTYACAFVAVVPSKVLHGLGRRLREAQELGSYQLVEPLGRGGMGEVWRAEHRLLAREAAIKLVRPELLGVHDPDEARQVLRRFEREARATAALGSPHSIQVFDFGLTTDGVFYYVMELLAGRDLESLVREFGPIPADRALFLLRQICHSLADAHSRGLVHRDIKPANIYVCRLGLDYDFVKVLDFGLVKLRDRAPGDTLATLSHVTSGTPAYMAPEAILGDHEVDRRADIYALGCVVYYLLTGTLVFEADSSMKMLMQHLNAAPPPPSERSELPIPPALDALVLACLQKDPAGRPQTAQALLRMVDACQPGGTWTADEAERWWKAHLPHLTGRVRAVPRRDETQPVVPA